MLAQLILMTFLTFPHISDAIASVESNHNPRAVGRMNEKGMYQVMEKFHGKVSKSVKQQMIQHDRILNELLRECGCIVDAVSRYNGGKNNKRYIGKVTRAILQRELLGV